MARTRRRQGRIEYKQPDGSWSRTKPTTSKPSNKPAVKPTSSKPNPYTSGKPNPNAGGGVKGKPVPKGGALSAYKNDVAALKRLVKAGGPLARQAAKRLAVLGVRAVPGAVVAGAIAGSAGRPGAAQMSRLGLSPGRSTKSADAPTYKTPLNQSSKPKPKPTATTASKPKPKPTTTTASKPKPTRQNVTPSKPKPQTVDGKTVKRVGPVSTPADKPKMNKAKIDKAMASTRKAYLKSEQEKAKQASIAEGKRRRSSRNTTVRGPRERRYGR